MHEREKLEEAKYFYSRMVEEQTKVNNFKFNLSAFLSSSRSVLQYALEEAKKIRGGQKWYDNFMSNSPILRFFKDKRDINIHTEPIEPQKIFAVTIVETMALSDSVSVILRNKNGKVKQRGGSKPHIRSENEKVDTKPATVQVKYNFTDWNGKEDVLMLSHKYIQELEKMVRDGIGKGFIKG
jgi:hypothetical protein